MANKYKYSSSATDITSTLEPTAYTAAEWCSYFKGESCQKAGPDTNTNNTTISTSYFKYGSSGTGLKGVKRGYFPTVKTGTNDNGVETIFAGASLFYTVFASSTSDTAGTMTRNTDGITFAFTDGTNVTLGPSHFRNGYVPKEIIMLLVGGGGGGGGTSYFKYDKDDYRPARGAGGSGGGCLAVRFQLQDNVPYYIKAGGGGLYGSSGASGGENDSTSGSYGSNTVFMNKNTNTNIFVAYGGAGGGGGDLSGNYGASRDGGTYYVNPNYTASGIPGAKGVNGGKGNSMGSISVSGISALTWNPTDSTTGSTTATFVTAKNNNGAAENYSDTHKSVDGLSYYSGGCSLGYGSFWTASGNTISVTNIKVEGGGGVSGFLGTGSGAGGLISFFY